MQHTQPYLHLLLHSADLLEEQLRLRLAKLNVTPRQARILDALDRMGAASQADLSREFDLTAAESEHDDRQAAGGGIHFAHSPSR